MIAETHAVQDYLKAIYQLGGDEAEVPTSELADRLDVTPASVSAMVRRLHTAGLVVHRRYQGVRLSPAGVREAVEVIRHHRLLELYLAEKVGLSWDKVHEEAEVLEHVLSEDLEARLDELLGHPTTDPHGHPIPSVELDLAEDEHPTLDALTPGDAGVVRWVSDRDPDLLRHLDDLGLRPGAKVRVEEVVPYGGGIRARVGRAERLVGHVAAKAVSVQKIGKEAAS